MNEMKDMVPAQSMSVPNDEELNSQKEGRRTKGILKHIEPQENPT